MDGQEGLVQANRYTNVMYLATAPGSITSAGAAIELDDRGSG
jgi:hypothetical protein